MINYETLLSSYDDKLTLMQWLKKVEAALKDASAVSFKVNKRGDATLTFSVVFEDGSELETGPIILPQGPQGESVQGAAIRNGHLILTLTNGDELDAGNLGAVSGFSINASQHLIVTFQNGTTQDLGAIFTGDVTLTGNLAAAAVKTASLTSDEGEIAAQKPVVEVMNGYSITPTAENINLLYAGAAKNGNKLSFAFFGTYSHKSDDVIIPFANIGIPAAIGDKIVPYELSGENRIIYSGVGSLFSSRTAYKSCIVEMQKLTNSLLRIIFVNLNSSGLVDGTTYYFRIEATFLLSDNLAA